MVAAANLVEVAALVGDTARATMLSARMGGLIYVRFTPKSGHRRTLLSCPLCAISGHWHVYSVTLSTISYAGG